MKGKTFDEIEIGDKASFQKTITENDVCLFAGITGDFNPLHINEIVANESIFNKRIAHGLLVSGLISTVLGIYLPGPGTLYDSQNLKFKRPVFLGDTIIAECEIIEKDKERNRVKLRTICRNQNKELVITGEAVVLPPKE